MSTFPDIENRTYKNVQVLEYRKVFPVVKMKLFHSAAEWQKIILNLVQALYCQVEIDYLTLSLYSPINILLIIINFLQLKSSIDNGSKC